MGIYIQYGCGWSAPKEWKNYDASPTLRLERLPLFGKLFSKNKVYFPRNVEYGDIIKGLPVKVGSCRGVYCSHVLEHLSLEEFRIALYNTYTMLKPGGIFRCVLPDLEYYINEYRNNLTDDAALAFMRETYLGQEMRIRSFGKFIISWIGNSRHLWMWDYKSFKSELKNHGFDLVRRANYGDSSDPRFGEVEDKARWDNCLGIECQKPDSGDSKN